MHNKMLYGVHIFPTQFSFQPDELARAAEERGLDSVWFSEHSHIPVRFLNASTLPDHLWQTYDIFVAMTLAAVRALRMEGIPLVGYTWFPLFSMIDWAYRKGLRPLKDYLIHLGLYDSEFDSKGRLRRRKTPLVKRYQRHIANPMPPIGI